jgi:hypothetical protein
MPFNPESLLLPAPPDLVRPPLSADEEALHREAMAVGHAAMAVFEAETLETMARFADVSRAVRPSNAS